MERASACFSPVVDELRDSYKAPPKGPLTSRGALGAAEPDGLAAFVRSRPASIGARQEHERSGLVEPRPAAQDAILALGRTLRIAVGRDLVILLLVPVGGPL